MTTRLPPSASKTVPILLGTILLASTLPFTPSAQAESLWAEDFEEGIPDGWTTTGLWRASTCQSPNTGTNLAFNTGSCPGTYDTGARSFGRAISPLVDVPHGDPKLTWIS